MLRKNDQKNYFVNQNETTFKILYVKVVKGESLNPGWHTPMQVITTDKGEFIDNMPGNQFGYYKKANPGWDWNKEIGKNVSETKVIWDKGFCWLNKN